VINARWKRNVLSCFLNTSVLEQCCKSFGRLFHAAGPTKLNPRSPNLVRVQRLTYRSWQCQRNANQFYCEWSSRATVVTSG